MCTHFFSYRVSSSRLFNSCHFPALIWEAERKRHPSCHQQSKMRGGKTMLGTSKVLCWTVLPLVQNTTQTQLLPWIYISNFGSSLKWCVPTSEHLPFCESWNMTTSSHTCPVPAVNGHMTHYPAAPYPLLFPPVIGGLSLPPLHGLHGHPPPSGCSTPSPASK